MELARGGGVPWGSRGGGGRGGGGAGTLGEVDEGIREGGVVRRGVGAVALLEAGPEPDLSGMQGRAGRCGGEGGGGVHSAVQVGVGVRVGEGCTVECR